MEQKTKRAICLHVERILSDFSFENRRKKHSEECPCYQQNKPCHNIPIKELNCFLCYCPNYDTERAEGGCKIGNPEDKGKWFYHACHEKGRIWDCSDCGYPNRKEVVKKYLNKLFGLKD